MFAYPQYIYSNPRYFCGKLTKQLFRGSELVPFTFFEKHRKRVNTGNISNYNATDLFDGIYLPAGVYEIKAQFHGSNLYPKIMVYDSKIEQTSTRQLLDINETTEPNIWRFVALKPYLYTITVDKGTDCIITKQNYSIKEAQTFAGYDILDI